ncbi:MFS transporter [Hazenella sp. IB182357]|uniref:MFS transporter n=1 Tax=Polycladospora coralii TaxID=2771432 RepID=A0A926NA13_9BACL|nr:MFS transporter [Polycladospora coralii]MBD1372622.1 MFS transporter [Polycladospora coralii]MBS7531270.1 MFS transporter [Polycladospora coralii]
MTPQFLKDLKQMDRNIWIRFAGESLNSIAMMMMFPFFALYLKDRLDSLTQVGIVIAIGPAVAVVGSIIGGRWADTYGRKPIMIISMIGNGLILLGFIYTDGFLAYSLLSAGMGFFNSLFHPAATAMVADVTPPEKRTEAYGLLRMGHNIGAAFGPLIGASIIHLPKSIIFFTASFSLILYAVVVWIWIKETLPDKHNQVNEVNAGFRQSISAYKAVFKDRLLILFILTGIVISMSFSQTEGMLPIHFDLEMKHIFGLQNPFFYLLALNGFLVVLFQFPISRWATHKSIGFMMFWGASLFGFGMVFIGWLPVLFGEWHTQAVYVLIALGIAFTIYTIGEMMMSPVQMTFVANIAPEDLRGTYMGAASWQWIAGETLGPIIGGYMFDLSLGNLLFTSLGVGCMIAGIVYVFLDRFALQKKRIQPVTEVKVSG